MFPIEDVADLERPPDSGYAFVIVTSYASELYGLTRT